MTDIKDVPVIEPGIYEHFKGNRYEVIGVALHTDTLEPHVVYKPMYKSECKYWIRPYKMFIENIERDGNTIPRFKKIG